MISIAPDDLIINPDAAMEPCSTDSPSKYDENQCIWRSKVVTASVDSGGLT